MSTAAVLDAPPAVDADTPNPWAVTGVVMLGMIMSIIDASIVNVAIPHMMGTLGVGVSEISWVASAYTLANVVMIPLSAWLGSVIGRSRMYWFAIMVFTASSALCGVAPTLPWLIFARVLQGFAAGAMMPTGQAILYEAFPPEKRGTSMAVFGLGIMVGPAIGPTLGGFITDNYGWPWIFYINLPIGLLGMVLVPLVLRDPSYLRRRAKAGGDVMGIILLASGVALLQYVLEQGEDAGWFQADWIVMSLTTSALLLMAFVLWELSHPDPAVELRVFEDVNFRAAALVNVAVGVGLMGGMFMLPLFLNQLLGFSATQSGIALVPGALATAVAMPICGKLSDRGDVRLLSGFGLVVFAWSMWMMGQLDSRAGMNDLLLPQILRGIGMAFCFVPLSVAAMARIPRERMGQATGLFNLTRQLGGSLGIVWLSSLIGRYRAIHQANLIGYINPYSDVVQDRLAAVNQGTLGLGLPPGAGRTLGPQLLYGHMMRASVELAFRDMFVTIMVLFLLSLPLLGLLQRRAPGAPAAKVQHAE